MKLKHVRDYEKNCAELEEDWRWFKKWYAIMMLGLIGLIFLAAYFAKDVDEFFKSLVK